MKILEERLLLNNLKDTLDVVEEVTLIKRIEGSAVVAMTLEQYNELLAKLYHSKEQGNV